MLMWFIKKLCKCITPFGNWQQMPVIIIMISLLWELKKIKKYMGATLTCEELVLSELVIFKSPCPWVQSPQGGALLLQGSRRGRGGAHTQVCKVGGWNGGSCWWGFASIHPPCVHSGWHWNKPAGRAALCRAATCTIAHRQTT